jgi:hypothetical protein
MQRALFAVAAVEVMLLLLLPAPRNPEYPGITGGIRTAAALLRGEGPPVDLAQDYIGARRLVRGDDTYPRLTAAFAELGLRWPVNHRSTHPPTAFLLVLPVAWLPWDAASAVWAALMLCAIAVSYWLFGASPGLAAALGPLTLLWPSAAWSLGQLTPLWLLGLAVGWGLRQRPAGAGAGVAFAALTKFLPAVSLVPLLLVLDRRRVLLGFAAVWAAALGLLLVLGAGAIGRFLELEAGVAHGQAARGENAGLLWAAGHAHGAVGVAAALALLAAVVVFSIRRLRALGRLDRWTWDAWSWIGVALLPIAWIYSLLPLLPTCVRIARRGWIPVRPLALVPVVLPFLIDPFGVPGGIHLAVATACLGLALLVDAAVPEPTPAPATRSDLDDVAAVSRERA